MKYKFTSVGAFFLALILLFAGLMLINRTASSQTATATPITSTETSEPTVEATVTDTTAATTAPTEAATTAPTEAATAAPTVTRTPTRTPTTSTIPVTSQVGTTPRTVSVTGTGSVEGQPDMAVVVIGVRTEDETAAAALNANSTQMQALLTTLQAEGVQTTDIRTLTVQLQPRFQTPSPNSTDTQATVNGFIAINTVEVTVRSLANLGGLLDAAVEAGGNQLEGIRFDFSDPSALIDDAREAAMTDARHKAEQLTQLAGARLGVVVTIVETSNRPFPVLRELARTNLATDVPIASGTQTIQVDIQVTWEIQ